jgi:hypothetical protein
MISTEENEAHSRGAAPGLDLSPNPAATSASNADALKSFDGSQQDWMHIGVGNNLHPSGPDVQHGMQALALGSGYGTTENGISTDTGLSPDSNSNRLTPNSTTSSESRVNPQSAHNNSGITSYETSPASSSQPRTESRMMSAFFSGQPDYNDIPSTGMTPDSNAYHMPETPGRDFSIPAGWEMGQQNTGMTPVGEGVFRQLMGLGPLDPMDLGWEGGS